MAEQCKCGSLDFFMDKQGNNTGLYCSMCGKWQKWMNKDEIRVFEYNHKPKARNTIKQTNADRIRSMSDLELSNFIKSVHYDGTCREYAVTHGQDFTDMFGNKDVMHWLQSEVKGSE